jgi:glycosyltransferase involved in cell wall biosynthesis
LSIISIVWSSGKAHGSIHQVHEQIISLVADKGEIHTWMLHGRKETRFSNSGNLLNWQLSAKVLKGRSLWRLLQWRLQRRLAREIERIGPKMLLLDGIGVARLIVPLVARLKLPELQVVVVFHGQSRIRQGDQLLFGSIPAPRLKLVAVSEALAESLSEKLGRSVLATRTAINPSSFQQALLSRDEARAKLGVVENCVLLGAVGRLVEEKGFLPMLDVLSTLARGRADIQLVIIGEGEQRSLLEEHIRKLGLERIVTLAGHRQDAARLYQAFDIMLIPSRNEGLGLVLQEAVMAHVPVVASNLPVFVEQLGLSGVYVSPDDVSGWVAAIEQVLDSDRQLLASAQSCQLEPENAWKQFCKGYEELLTGGSGSIRAS